MFQSFRLSYVIILLILGSVFFGCGGSKETVNYEPPPDPFPRPEEETFTERASMPIGPPEVEEPKNELVKAVPLILTTVNFDFNQSRLTDEAKALLAQNASTLHAHPETNIRIEGHCDERGTVEFNLALGERRAMAVRNYMINFGVPARRMTIISYGKERPVDPRHTSDAWAANRRAEFIIRN